MIKDKISSLKKKHALIKSKKSKKELSLKEMQEIVKLKVDIDNSIQLLKDILFALSEAEGYAKTFTNARAKIKKEINNLEVTLKTL